MPGFPNEDAIINALSVVLAGQGLSWNKVASSVTVANTPHSLWKATGAPTAGTDGTTGPANGRVCTSATTGAYPYTNEPGGTYMDALTQEMTTLTASSTGQLILFDRITDCTMNLAQATSAITGMDATSRLPSGAGGNLWIECASALTTATVFTLTGTDQGGSAFTTPQITSVASAIIGRSINANLIQPLGGAVQGVRTITNITAVSGAGTGQMTVCIVRKILSVPLPAVAIPCARDLIREQPRLPRIYSSSCLFWVFVPTAAVTATFVGDTLIAYN